MLDLNFLKLIVNLVVPLDLLVIDLFNNLFKPLDLISESNILVLQLFDHGFETFDLLVRFKLSAVNFIALNLKEIFEHQQQNLFFVLIGRFCKLADPLSEFDTFGVSCEFDRLAAYFVKQVEL